MLGGAYIFGQNQGPQLGLSTFKSIQVGSGPTNGYILQTDGTDSTWVVNSGGGGGGGGIWSYDSGDNEISPIVASSSNSANVLVSSIHATSTATSSIFDGSLGIGTSSPFRTLGVQGAFALEGTNASIAQFQVKGAPSQAGNIIKVIDANDSELYTVGPTGNMEVAGSLTLTGNFIFGGDTFDELVGTGLQISGGDLQTTLGTSIAASEIADGDHGFFSYSSGVTSLDSGGLTSANLSTALTNETGTGVAVFSVSPTFTGTPVLPSTFTIGSNSFIRSGAHNLTLTTSATTNATIPAGTVTLASLSGTQTFTGAKTFSSSLTAGSLLGTLDAGGATAFEIPNGADQTLNAVGRVSVNTNDNTFEFATSTNASFPAIITPYDPITFDYASSTWTATATIDYHTLSMNERVKTGVCSTNAGTAIIRVGDGSNWSNQISLTTSTTTVNFTSNNTFNKGGERVVFEIGTPASSVVQVDCNFERYYER